ncbi:MAG: DUF1501 domain-containing protein [Planctomycetales bacterium]|nr:DUF1501 domain-containing protein [Planctomycetales bacterium]
MKAHYACRSQDHLVNRRRFLGKMAAGMGTGSALGGMMAAGIGSLAGGVSAKEMQKRDMRVVVFNMHGGLSQLESWDPKPGTKTGGPTRAIPTSVPGIHISEFLPYTAKQMHHLCLMRGVNTSEDDHGKGTYLMLTGRRQSPAADYPQIGAVAAKSLCDESLGLPGHILITPGGGGGRGNEAAYLGPKYSSIALGGDKPPQNSVKPESISDQAEARRHAFRRQIDQRFLQQQRSAITDAYTYSYEQALRLMERRDVFDLSKEPESETQRYGNSDFGRQCLLARRLLENGVSFVQVTHSNYDTHNENFNFHIEQLGEFDRPFATLVDDLAQRGLLDQTLVVVLSEFGRTPNINLYYGRDHWSRAWSVVIGGAKVARGATFGATNEEGTEVTDGQVDHGQLFHTYLQAVGVDSTDSLLVDGRELPIADPSTSPIWDVLT